MDSESLSSWTNPPHQHSCREGRRVCWFLCWPPYKVGHCFSRWFMNIYMHKLFGKWKLICSPTGDDLAICFHQRTWFSLFKTRMLHCFPSHIPKCLDIKLNMLFLDEGQFCFIAMRSSSYYSTTRQFCNVSPVRFVCVWLSLLSCSGKLTQEKQYFSLEAIW